MLKIDKPMSQDITIFGNRDVRTLVHSLCGGFWILAKRPDALREFIENLPISNLSVRTPSSYAFTDVIVNKELITMLYDEVWKEIKDLPDEKLHICSDYVDIYLTGDTLNIDMHPNEPEE